MTADVEEETTPDESDLTGTSSSSRSVLTSDSSAIKGSLMFLVGRVASMALSMVVQILIVRSLPKDDFGSFAYALALAALIQSVLALGLDRADTVFLTRFDEAGDTGRLRGLLVLEVATVAVTGTTAVVVLAVLAGRVIHGVPVPVLLLLAGTAPLMALDALVLNAFAVFAHPRAIFLRRYVLDPFLRLTVVTVLLLTGMHIVSLAAGYLVAAVTGTTLYLVLLVRLVRKVTTAHSGTSKLAWPGAEVFAYALPLLLAAVMYAATTSVPTLVLQSYASTAAVAELRAVQPVAALILVVPTVFGTLFLPRAARLAAKQQGDQLREHYWGTAVWVGVLTFPPMLLFVCFSSTVTTLLFGDRYAHAALPLLIMTLAFYTSAAMGLNGSLLQVTGRLRWLTIANIGGLITAAVASLLLIPAFGAIGAALAVAAALVVPQVPKQLSLRTTPVKSAHPAAVRLWLTVMLLLALAFGISRWVGTNPVVAALTTVVCSLLLVAVMWKHLAASEVLPIPRRRRPAAKAPEPAVGTIRERTGGRPVADERTVDELATSVSAPVLPGTWQCLDWRFLSPDPALGATVAIAVDEAVRQTLAALGENLLESTGADTARPATADTVIIAGTRCTATELAAVRAQLRPGGRLVIVAKAPPPGRRFSVHPWKTWRRHVSRSGFLVDGTYAALPTLDRTSALVDLDEPIAIIAALRRQPVHAVKKLAATAAAALVRLGLREIVCREGFLIAHRPPAKLMDESS